MPNNQFACTPSDPTLTNFFPRPNCEDHRSDTRSTRFRPFDGLREVYYPINPQGVERLSDLQTGGEFTMHSL